MSVTPAMLQINSFTSVMVERKLRWHFRHFVRTSPNSNGERDLAWRVSAAFVERRKPRQLSSCRCRTTKRVCRSMKGPEERKLIKYELNNWCCNSSFDNLGITVHLQGEEQQKSLPRRCQLQAMSNTSPLKPFIKRAYCPYNRYLTKKREPSNSQWVNG